MTAAGEVLASFVCECCRMTIHLGVGVARPDPPLCRLCLAPFYPDLATPKDQYKARCEHVAAALAQKIAASNELPRPPRRGPLQRIGDWFR